MIPTDPSGGKKSRTPDPTDQSKTEASYPRVGARFFANRFLVYALRTGVNMDHGSQAFALLAAVVLTEDKTRYRKAVKFWNDNLTAYLGCREDRLSGIRKRLVNAGWLYYEPGRKGIAGEYWVLVPGGDSKIDDSVLGANPPENPGENPGHNSDIPPGKAGDKSETDDLTPGIAGGMAESGGNFPPGIPCDNAGDNAGDNALPFIPIPIPKPKDKERARALELIPAKLSELILAWNELPEGISARIVKPGAKPILTGWQRVQRDPEAAEFFGDIPTLMRAIEAGTFLHATNWFDLQWLLGKDRDRATWNVSKILAGRYVEKPKTNGKQMEFAGTKAFLDRRNP